MMVVGTPWAKVLSGIMRVNERLVAWRSSKPNSILIERFALYFDPQQAFVTLGIL